MARRERAGNLLPWSWAAERLERAHNYWVATRRPDGSPHLAAVWGVWDAWDGDAFYFSTGGGTRKARNLAADNRCVITPDHADEAVIVEGLAKRVTSKIRIARVMSVYTRKYGMGFPDPNDNPVFAVRPRTVFGIIENDPEFCGRATRWRF